MAGQTDIVNLAAILLGETPVVSIDDNTKVARTMKTIYDVERQNELRAHNWIFSLADIQIPSSATTPVPPYTQSYQLPADCLKLISMGGIRQQLDQINYRNGLEKLYIIRGRMLYTMMPAPQWINYVKDITNPTLFDPCFVSAFAARLAWTACESLMGSVQKSQKLRDEYNSKIQKALINNAVEQLPDGIADGAWVTGRL